MDSIATDFTTADIMIVAGAEVFRHDGEVMASGMGVLQRIAATLAVNTINPDLMLTDSQAWILSRPNPLGKRPPGFKEWKETWMGFSRVFDVVWSGHRHTLVPPSQIDRFGQVNISCLGDDYLKPKVQMLGARGYPGNSISHGNSYMVPAHNTRIFVSGEVDMVSGMGYNPERLPKGYSFEDIEIRKVITPLCVMDFGGPDYQARLVSVHQGVTAEQVQENTGFALYIEGVEGIKGIKGIKGIDAEVPTTPVPTKVQMEAINAIDPHNTRAGVL